MNSEISIYNSLVRGYDRGAEYFSETRCFFWRDLQFIKDYIKKNDKVLDYGSGNGRLLDLLNGSFQEYLGIDVSENLIEIAKEKYQGRKIRFKKIHPYSFSLPSEYFDVITAIGVFHHFPPGSKRHSILLKLHESLKPGGHLIITVWNLYQDRYAKHFSNKDKIASEGYIPFRDQQGKVLFNRYHYRWKLNELVTFIEKADFEIKAKGKTERNDSPANLYVVGRKP